MFVRDSKLSFSKRKTDIRLIKVMEANTREADKTITSVVKVLTYIITGCPIGLAAIS